MIPFGELLHDPGCELEVSYAVLRRHRHIQLKGVLWSPELLSLGAADLRRLSYITQAELLHPHP